MVALVFVMECIRNDSRGMHGVALTSSYNLLETYIRNVCHILWQATVGAPAAHLKQRRGNLPQQIDLSTDWAHPRRRRACPCGATAGEEERNFKTARVLYRRAHVPRRSRSHSASASRPKFPLHDTSHTHIHALSLPLTSPLPSSAWRSAQGHPSFAKP